MSDSTKLVAVIDDDESMRASTSSLLRSYGYTVRTFAGAAEFLQSDASTSSVCVISDIHMPEVDGFGLAKAYLERGGKAPVIFVTAFYDEKVASQAATLGAPVLKKPFEAEALVDAIEKARKAWPQGSTPGSTRR